MAEPFFYESRFGDLRLFLTKVSTDRSRTLVVHEPSSGDEYVAQDRGRAPLRTRCSVLFARMRGDDLSPIERCQRLQAAVDDKPRIFSHPTSGSYLARIGPFTEDIDEHSVITAEIEVLRVGQTEAVSPAGAGAIAATGVGAVDAAADALDLELADIAINSPLPADTKAAVASWSSTDTVNTRQVVTQVGSLTSRLGDQADDLEGDIGFWPAYKATVLLSEAVRLAAAAATSDTAQTFVVRIAAPVALRAVLASVYSAEEADARYDQVMLLNDIASPAWLEPGSDLVLPQRTAVSRSR